jgi:hypothetical protein
MSDYLVFKDKIFQEIDPKNIEYSDVAVLKIDVKDTATLYLNKNIGFIDRKVIERMAERLTNTGFLLTSGRRVGSQAKLIVRDNLNMDKIPINTDKSAVNNPSPLNPLKNTNVQNNSKLKFIEYSIEKTRITNFRKILEIYKGNIELKLLAELMEFQDTIDLQKWILKSNFKGFIIEDGQFRIQSSDLDLTESIDNLIKSFDQNPK